MISGALDVRSGLAAAVLVSSIAALAVTVRTVMKMPAKLKGPAEKNTELSEMSKALAEDLEKLQGEIEGRQAVVSAMLSRAAGVLEKRASIRVASSRPAAALKGPYEHFLHWLDEWGRLSSLRILGAAAECRDEIVRLAQSPPSEASEERFLACANNLVEFLVEATDTKFKQGAPGPVDAALESMVRSAGRELISPGVGTGWEPALHDVAGRLPRGPYRAGTIAKVSIRGLRGGTKRVIKARVFLHDD